MLSYIHIACSQCVKELRVNRNNNNNNNNNHAAAATAAAATNCHLYAGYLQTDT